MKLKIKKLNENVKIPSYAHEGDAGLDIVATDVTVTTNYVEYNTGLSFELPPGYVMLIFPRSSISNYDLILANGVGVLDSSYKGELKFRFKKIGSKIYKVGDKIGQIILFPYPQVTIEEVEELTETERGTNGFGSTGK